MIPGHEEETILKYDYIQIFLLNSSSYNARTQEMITQARVQGRHLFVYRYKENMERIKGEAEKVETNGETDYVYDSVYDPSAGEVEAIGRYLKKGRYVILHNLVYSDKEIAKIHTEWTGRILWFVWGGDLYRLPEIQNRCYMFVRSIYRLVRLRVYDRVMADKIIRKFFLINAVFPCDRAQIRRRFGKGPVVTGLSYSPGIFTEDFINWQMPYENHKKLHVMIGHSAYRFLKHKKYLKLFHKWKGKVRLFLPMNYGDMPYADQILAYAYRLYGNDDVVILRKSMTQKEYFQFLCGMDIAVFDYKQQSALANIGELMYLRKKIYLNAEGVLYKGYRQMGLEVSDVRELKTKTLAEIAKRGTYERNHVYAAKAFDREKLEQSYRNFFMRLEQIQ